MTEKYSWNNCKDRNYDFEFGGCSDWRFPNAIEAKYADEADNRHGICLVRKFTVE